LALAGGDFLDGLTYWPFGRARAGNCLSVGRPASVNLTCGVPQAGRAQAIFTALRQGQARGFRRAPAISIETAFEGCAAARASQAARCGFR
jgi:hypothetical protein